MRPTSQAFPARSPAARPHVVVLGGGFGGLAAARALARAPVHVTLLDRTNHHVFQPLLYQVATANLAASDIATPIRHALRRQRNATVLLAEATDVDLAARRVLLGRGRPPLAYDYLIVATGSRHAYFGHEAWEQAAPGLKTLEDALGMRRRLLEAFERAEVAAAGLAPVAGHAAGRLTFVVVGGGPTGVELAGMIPELAGGALRGEFRRIDPRRARVVLVESGPTLLPALPAPLGARARRDLEALGVEVRLGARVTEVTDAGVRVAAATGGHAPPGGEWIAAHTVLWAAGNQASPIGASLCRQAGLPTDHTGRVPVAHDLSLPDHPEVLVVGDLAQLARDPGREDGRLVPAVAPAAMQEGRHAGRNVGRLVAGRPTRAFVYRDMGEMATIGRHRAVASFVGGRLRLAGWAAWWFWLGLHLCYLGGFRNRLSVLLQWGYAYLFADRSARLIVGGAGAEASPPAGLAGRRARRSVA